MVKVNQDQPRTSTSSPASVETSNETPASTNTKSKIEITKIHEGRRTQSGGVVKTPAIKKTKELHLSFRQAHYFLRHNFVMDQPIHVSVIT